MLCSFHEEKVQAKNFGELTASRFLFVAPIAMNNRKMKQNKFIFTDFHYLGGPARGSFSGTIRGRGGVRPMERLQYGVRSMRSHCNIIW